MDFKKRIKMRHYVNIFYIILGPVLILIAYLSKSDNTFLYAYGMAMLIMGVIRMISHRKITKNEATMRQREISETYERNRMITERARSWAFSYSIMLAGITVIVLSLLGLHDLAYPFALFVGLMTALYWICWLIVRKKC